MAYRTTHGTDTAIVRLFNTYGPRMRADDGRAIPDFPGAGAQRAPPDRLRGRHPDALGAAVWTTRSAAFWPVAGSELVVSGEHRLPPTR
ncbi:MAG: hypothetical protein WKG07_00160 [Hymenobacter sp.]